MGIELTSCFSIQYSLLNIIYIFSIFKFPGIKKAKIGQMELARPAMTSGDWNQQLSSGML